jgi:hypothetical protein
MYDLIKESPSLQAAPFSNLSNNHGAQNAYEIHYASFFYQSGSTQENGHAKKENNRKARAGDGCFFNNLLHLISELLSFDPSPSTVSGDEFPN